MIMKTLYNYSNYGNHLKLTSQDAKNCSHSGDCENDVIQVMNKAYVKKQTALFNPVQLAKELSELGAWDEIELQNHDENIKRWVWISASDITERIVQ